MVFNEGDLVWLHLKKQRFLNQRNSKLCLRGDGPSNIIRKVNNNSYQLDLIKEYKVHSTFNVVDFILL